MSKLYFIKTHENTILPKRQTINSAGYDIYALNGGCVPASGRNRHVVDTGFAMTMMDNCYARIESRSSLAFKHDVTAFNGIIDADYTKEVKVLLYNNGTDPFHYKKGDRIAQMIIMEYVSNPNENINLKRTGGFGSTNEQTSDKETVDLTQYELNKSTIDTQFVGNLAQFKQLPLSEEKAYEIASLVDHHKAVTDMNVRGNIARMYNTLHQKANRLQSVYNMGM
tara:strand:+ start:2971 stop:3642 length:672 start_codon:yes stop_codon:yes gene_type:complete